VAEVVDELQTRMEQRGTIGQILKQEKMMKQLTEIDHELNLVISQMEIQYPPAEDTLKKLFGEEDSPLLPDYQPDKLSSLDRQVDLQTFDITNRCDACTACLCTCGMAGCARTVLELRENDLVVTESNNLGEARLRMPYAQLDTVDSDKLCCCCWGVNQWHPGWGCERSLVTTLASELHDRKEKRGQIAQVRQLEQMQGMSLEMDVMADLILNRQGILYPPAQSTVQEIYGHLQPPRAITTPPPMPHIDSVQEFEHQEYDITNYCESVSTFIFTLGLAGCTKTTMHLSAEEMHIITSNLCSVSNARTPYGNLGSVDTNEACCGCCVSLPGVAAPACGCSKDTVQTIAGELQMRKEKRGNIAQLKMQENMVIEVMKLSAKIDVLLHASSRSATLAQDAPPNYLSV